jgi:tight adherence protein C
MVALVLPLSFAIAAFLLVRTFATMKTASTVRPAWQQEIIGQREKPTEQPARRRRRESLRTKSMFERLIQAPPSLTGPADRMVSAAGLGDEITGAAFVGISAMVGMIATLLTFFYVSPQGFTQQELSIVIGLGALGLAAPTILVNGRATRRREEITRELPDLVDLLTVSIEAGLALEAALSRVSERGEGPLAQEVRRTLSEISLGRQRRDALRSLGVRTNVPAVVAFVNSLNQADQSGMELGPVLRAQADVVRQRRRQRAEEAAMKAPIKMLFPLIMFIFPSIFVILLGPAAIQMVETFD